MKYLRHEHHNDDGVITAVVFEAFSEKRRRKRTLMRMHRLSGRQWKRWAKMFKGKKKKTWKVQAPNGQIYAGGD